ncbi:MAG TPA: response regulator transcription factor [Kofleriaceae bacterium]
MPSAAIHLAIVEDDVFASAIAQQAMAAGFTVQIASSEQALLAELESKPPDAIVLGSLVNVDPIALCHTIRERSEAPVVAVLASLRPESRIELLDAGSDDVVTRQCHLLEIIARVRAHVRRARGELRLRQSALVVGNVVIDTVSRTANVEGAEVSLSLGELLVLTALSRASERALTREQLLEELHGNADDVFDRSIDVVVSRLRAKLGAEARRLKTVRGVGYMLVVQ